MTKSKTPTGPARERVTNARNLSKAESEVALWVERNFDNLPFETAADLAIGAGVSEMTVSRFVRRLGYANFKAFKAAVNAEFRKNDNDNGSLQLRRIAIPEGTGSELDAQLQLELDAIVEVYRMAQTPQWAAALDVVQEVRHVNVTGFQGVKGAAMDFATRLKYARPGVRFADGRTGNWSELFIEEPETSCVIMVEVVPYAHEAVKVADMCLRRDIPLIMITDQYSAWPRKYTPYVLSVATSTRAFLDSTAGIAALLGLFLSGITARVGAPAQDRLRQMRELAAHFDPFSYEPGSQMRPILPSDRKEESQ
ncbi:MurR/RpiR family transcriptional regulator [Sulfitobacter delicatus]|uniref:DNA-binding transcriptional regulator, MurR/RpiR family, contains HTH and SIS domains n=1 Tax=Sulfitobacter delicatus TaxID=218672 RepID=A0A1G7TCD2_9RHOB|nr:MurR/RpiR family transcriptional regulator [Sulfitobacter delicatus]SDG33037.1 DNA-binding transcriptional regulator, MurR/RpiR family, contains HTH and SIS domains [Sulfitobacter delicatus]